MYSYIKGNIVEKNPAYVVIDVNGIGYFINISVNTFSLIKDKDICRLFIHFVVREDAQMLFGFANQEERKLFRHLISVSGIGANTAILILSSIAINEIIEAIISKNVSILQSVKGIGAKSAQRIIIDLKDKLEKEGVFTENLGIIHNTKKEEALSALTMLGFKKSIAENTINKIIKLNKSEEEISVEQLIKEALKVL